MNQNQQFQANLQTIKQMAEVLARQERVKSIKKIVAERRIETLCHFTRVENLSSILRKGLLGRSQLVERRIQFEKIDHNRQDGCPEAVCLTISFPNYKLFYTKRNNYGDWHGVDHNQWVVLLLDARLLWELDCAFCKYNAADSSVAGLPLEDRKKTEALESMFGDFPTLNRRWNFPLNFPTSPQAEVLVFDAVPISYLCEIHFCDYNAYEDWSNSHYTANSAAIRFGDHYFKKRTIR